MKSLKTLVRMQRLKLEDQQRQLSQLDAVAEGFRRQIRSLDGEMRREAGTVDSVPDAAHMIGGFVQGSLSRRATLEASLTDIENRISEVRAAVAKVFQEIKRYETIMERREEQERIVAGRRARKKEDELAMGVFQRNKRLETG